MTSGTRSGSHGAERKLVELHDCHVELLTTRNGGILDKRALNAVANITARTIIDHLDAIIAQQVAQQVIRGCLAVRSRDEDDARRLVDISKERRIDLLGDNARHLPGIAARELKRRSRSLDTAIARWKRGPLAPLVALLTAGFPSM